MTMSTDNTGMKATHYVLRDVKEVRENLFPLTFTRPVAEIRMGIYTCAERWRKLASAEVSYDTADYLDEIYGKAHEEDDMTTVIAAHFIATEDLSQSIAGLQAGERLVTESGEEIAHRGQGANRDRVYKGDLTAIYKLYHIFGLNNRAMEIDFEIATAGQESKVLPNTNRLVGDRSRLFIHQDAGDIECSNFNTKDGPIYIGPGVEIMEGSNLRGPIAVLDGSTINMGAKIYGATTIGPHSKVGGEINNVVITGYSNKAHDGFLGNAVLGTWCNIGGGCTASNLKNDYTEIKLWNYPSRRFERTGLIHCGLIMADHSKAGINTMLNTATVVGVGVNIHGTGFPRNFIASFSDGSAAGFAEVPLKKFLDTARRVMGRRNVELTPEYERLYSYLYELTETYR